MTEPRDRIEEWLGREVEPLVPPPGAFDRIQRRARRRKLNQAMTAAAGAVVVIAGAVLVPTVVRPGLPAGRTTPVPPAATASTPTSGPSHSQTASASTTTPAGPSQTSSPPYTGGTGLSATSSGGKVPPDFRPTSITMIGTSVGAVIGQAGTPGQCGPPVPADCTSLAGTSSYGASWYGVSAPVTGPPDGSTGVGQLRFLDLTHGWAFGPELWATSDGGHNWAKEQTSGLRVTGLEAAGSRAFAVLASCQGAGTAFAANCSTFSLYSTVAGSTALRRVTLSIPAHLRPGAMGVAGQPSSATLVIAGVPGAPSRGRGYLLAPSGDILSGSVGGGAWSYTGKAPCAPGQAAVSGAPLGAQLTVGAGSRLLLNCATVRPGGGAQQAKRLWVSTSHGASWRQVGQPPAAGRATSLAGTSSGQVVLATTAGIDYSADGRTWRSSTITGGSPKGGFSYVGMTSTLQGVAVPVNAGLGEVFVTSDGGQTWAASHI